MHGDFLLPWDRISKQITQQKQIQVLLSIESWLFNRDPYRSYSGLWNNPHTTGLGMNLPGTQETIWLNLILFQQQTPTIETGRSPHP